MCGRWRATTCGGWGGPVWPRWVPCAPRPDPPNRTRSSRSSCEPSGSNFRPTPIPRSRRRVTRRSRPSSESPRPGRRKAPRPRSRSGRFRARLSTRFTPFPTRATVATCTAGNGRSRCRRCQESEDPRSRVDRLRRRPNSPTAADVPAIYGTVGTAPTVSGTEQPRELADAIPLVERAFAFMDLCGFTKFIATNGEHAAIEALSSFRTLTRELGTRRGVRVAKWLGDGAMLVGVDVGPTIAAAAELIARYEGHSLALRGGLAHGRV